MKMDEKKILTILLFASLTALLLSMTTMPQEFAFGTPSEDVESDEVEEEEVDEVEEEEVDEVEEEEVDEVKEEEVDEVKEEEEEESNESDYTNIAKEDQEEEIDETREIDENEEEPESTESDVPQTFKIYEKPDTKEFKSITNLPSLKISKIEEPESTESDVPQTFKIYEKPDTKEFKSITSSNLPSFTTNKIEIEEPRSTEAHVQSFGLGGSLGKAWEQIEDSPIGKVGGDILEAGTGCRDTKCLSDSKGNQIVTEGLSCGIGGCNNPATMTGGSSVQTPRVTVPSIDQILPPVKVDIPGTRIPPPSEALPSVGDWINKKVGGAGTEGGEIVRENTEKGIEDIKDEGDRVIDRVNQVFTFNIPVPFTIPGTALTGTILLTGDYRYLYNTDFEITIAGFKPTDFPQIGSDYTIEQHFEATIEDIIRDLSGGTITQIDEGKQFISETLGIQIGPLATFKMDLAIKIPLPNSVSDITSLKNLLNSMNPVPSVVLTGCYNKISNNLPEVEKVNDVEGGIEKANEVSEVIEDPNKAINQEEVCTTLISI